MIHLLGCGFSKAVWTSLSGFLYHISPALVTLVIGSFVLQRFFISRSNEAAFIDNLLDRLETLKEDAIEYWATDLAIEGEARAAKALEPRIKGAIKSLAGDLAYYSQRYTKGEDFLSLLAELADACTGGNFESAARKPDSGRYIYVVNGANRVRTALLRRKL